MGAYENPQTVIDTESGKMMGQAIAGVGQSFANAITKFGQRRRLEAKEKKKANKAFMNSTIKYNDTYTSAAFQAGADFNKAQGLDISPMVMETWNKWADEGATLKAKRDASDNMEERRELQKEIAKYDKYFLGGGMTTDLGNFSGVQDELSNLAGPTTLSKVNGIAGSQLNTDMYKNFTGLTNGNLRSRLNVSGFNNEGGLGLSFDFGENDDGEKMIYTGASLDSNFVTVADMQKGYQDPLKVAGMLTENNNLNKNSSGFDKFKDKGENYKTKDAQGNTVIHEALDFNKFRQTLKGTFLANIAGYSAEGSVASGDVSMGMQNMQAYLDDILDEANPEIKAYFLKQTQDLGYNEGKGIKLEEVFLEAGSEGKTILDKQSVELMELALSVQSFIPLQNSMDTITVQPSSEYKGPKGERDIAILTNDFNDTVSVSIREGGGITDLYNQVKRSPLDYNYEDNQFDNKVRSQKDYKEEIENSTPQELYDQGLVATFTESERKNPYQTNSDEFKNSVQEKMNNYLATLGDKEDVFVNYDTGEELREEQALTMLFKSTPKYSNLESSEIKKMVNQAMKERPEKPDEEFKEDVARFQTDNVDDVESGEFSKEYKSATEEIASYSSPFFSRFRPDEVAKRKKERSKIVTKQKKDRKLLEEKYPNVTWPWEK